jgi:hypothetical protein
MSQQITNEQAERLVLAFYLVNDEDEKYDEFREYYNGIMLMIAHKHFGWTSDITELGYAEVMLAYNSLDELGFTKEITDEEIDYAVRMLNQ